MWRSFCSNITSTVSATGLKKVVFKDYSYQSDFVQKDYATFVTTLKESAELLLQTMFPGSTRTTSHSKSSRNSTFSDGLGAGCKDSHGGKTGMDS